MLAQKFKLSNENDQTFAKYLINLIDSITVDNNLYFEFSILYLCLLRFHIYKQEKKKMISLSEFFNHSLRYNPNTLNTDSIKKKELESKKKELTEIELQIYILENLKKNDLLFHPQNINILLDTNFDVIDSENKQFKTFDKSQELQPGNLIFFGGNNEGFDNLFVLSIENSTQTNKNEVTFALAIECKFEEKEAELATVLQKLNSFMKIFKNRSSEIKKGILFCFNQSLSFVKPKTSNDQKHQIRKLQNEELPFGIILIEDPQKAFGPTFFFHMPH